jgi:hypothetical protein
MKPLIMASPATAHPDCDDRIKALAERAKAMRIGLITFFIGIFCFGAEFFQNGDSESSGRFG